MMSTLVRDSINDRTNDTLSYMKEEVSVFCSLIEVRCAN